MKLTTIRAAGRSTPTALLTSGDHVNLSLAAGLGLLGDATVTELAEVLNLDEPLFERVRLLVDTLESGGSKVLEQLRSEGGLIPGEGCEYAPMLRPGLILACGMAYKEHMAEMGVPIPEKPTGFMKSPNAMVAHNEAIVLPASDPDMIDYECELACVIGRPIFNASPEEVMSCIAGYTMLNDVGSRGNVTAWLSSMEGSDARQSVGLYTATVLDKQLPGFCPLGPVVETFDTFGDPTDFDIGTRLNGELVQSTHSSDLIFAISDSLSFFSQWYKFVPGDVYSTGSPSGVGFARTPPRMLQEGDVVEVFSPKIGTLSNPVVREV